jgi:hypothetical protein
LSWQAFDLIFLNGKPLLREPLRKRRYTPPFIHFQPYHPPVSLLHPVCGRLLIFPSLGPVDPSPSPSPRAHFHVFRELLHSSFEEVEGKFAFAVAQDHKEDGDTLPIETFLADAVTGNCEGLMIKTLDDTYEPIKRCVSICTCVSRVSDASG